MVVELQHIISAYQPIGSYVAKPNINNYFIKVHCCKAIILEMLFPYCNVACV